MRRGVSKEREKRLAYKIDLEKAYDRLCVMARKGFGTKWRNWIEGCLSSSHFSIIINGTPKIWSKVRRSPFPFH